ncbi:hypothetical protein MJ588_02800 [Klebsiella pneumoniae]|nr:hypothetical protein MJ588_02800 [Klebsiella pneumoniae]
MKAFPELAGGSKRLCKLFLVIPDTKADFDFTAQRLNIDLFRRRPYPPPRRDISHRDQFDDGINALLVNYQFSGSNVMQANDE